MSLLDPKERSARGARIRADITASAAADPATLFEGANRDFLYAEIWSRPELDLRSRYLISLAGAACGNLQGDVRNFARGALSKSELSLAELREAALHIGIYGGWGAGTVLDNGVTEAAADLGLSEPEVPPVRAEPWDAAQRIADGEAGFADVMKSPGPPPATAFFQAGILNFVFGEMWMRPGLDQRSRRWITLVGVANSSSHTPIYSHIWSAMASGNATVTEMQEFVLQYAFYGGWPRASVVQGAVLEMAKKVAEGKAWNG